LFDVFSGQSHRLHRARTILGVVKKASANGKSKKKSKHLFCIVNDIQNCYQAKQRCLPGDSSSSSGGDDDDDDDAMARAPAPDDANATATAGTCDAAGHLQGDDGTGTTTHANAKNTNYEGLADLLHHSQTHIHAFVSQMENRVRLGDHDARWQMLRALPLQCFVKDYPRIFNVVAHKRRSANNNPSKGRRSTWPLCIHIHMLPEITVLLHQCMMPTKQYEDDLIILIRSCIPFFQNPRRVKHDHAWPEQNDQTLCMLLKWCMPSMLSLYPQACVKDVNFEVRLGLMRLFRQLLVGSFQDRNNFYLRHKTLIKMCLMEYVYYIIQHVNALPQTQYIKSINIGVMATNIFNIGQQFRVELNLEFAKTDQSISTVAMMRLLQALQPKCHIMFERCCRYNKNSLHCAYTEMYNTSPSPSLHSGASTSSSTLAMRNKRVPHELDPQCFLMLSNIPYTRFFAVFEMYCRRNAIASTHINMLWDHMQLIQVYEVSVDLIQQQTKLLRANWDCNKVQIHRQSTLLVCMLCAQKNVFPTFRHDVRNNKYTCNRCNIGNSVFEIDLIGRIVVVCNVPLVFSLCCQKIVILSGQGTEFCAPTKAAASKGPAGAPKGAAGAVHALCFPHALATHDTDPKAPAPSCPCISWDKHTTTLNFSQVLASISIAQHIVRYEPPVLRKWDTASREYMQLRVAGNTSEIAISQHARNMCCMCRINAVQNKYTLLDIYNNAMVVIPVCSKHSLPQHLYNTVHTVAAYVDTMLARMHRRQTQSASGGGGGGAGGGASGHKPARRR